MTASTLSKARFLYSKLNVGASDEQQELYREWLRFVLQHETQIEHFYAEDGSPSVLVFRGETGVPVCAYRWLPPECRSETASPVALPVDWHVSSDWTAFDASRVRGVFFFAHGITEATRFSLLNLKNIEQCVPVATLKSLDAHQHDALMKLVAQGDDCCVEEFNNGWVDHLCRAGYAVYGLDMQGHGLSQSWRNSRCNVERFDHYIIDTLNLILALHRGREWQSETPLFVSGLSMGGCIATRLCQLAFSQKKFRLPGDAETPSLDGPVVSGLVLFCPALSAERLKRQWINRLMILCGQHLSNLIPTAEMASLAAPNKYPWLREVIVRDPLVHTRRLPTRLSWEIVAAMEKIFPNVESLPPGLGVCLIQSKMDTMTDPEGSAAFLNMIACRETKVHWLDYGWHFLSKEPGNGNTIRLAISFMDSNILSKRQGEPVATSNEGH